MTEPKKASDILLSLEHKIDTLVSIVRSQDLNLKILSNKLSQLMEINASKSQTTIAKPTVEATGISSTLPRPTEAYNPHNLPLPPVFQSPTFIDQTTPSTNISLETNPNGFPRTARPETFDAASRFPEKQMQPANEAVIQIPNTFSNKTSADKMAAPTEIINTKIPVEQRVVDKNGKSVYLAEIEVMDAKNLVVAKSKTNAVGKWKASLPIGKYSVVVKKHSNSLKDQIHINQEINIDGRSLPQEIETLIVK
jgi:hypothetical protein